jgi:two-component system, sensor histidine kinase
VELRRGRLSMVAVDLLLAVLIGIEVSVGSALLWLAGVQILQWQRRRAVLAFGGQMEIEDFMRSMTRWWALLGWSRAAVVAIAFLYGGANSQLIVTMIVIGLAAGSVATSGGELRLMRAWSYPALGALVVGWAAQLDWLGITLAVLTLGLARQLIGYVELGGKQGRQLIDYAIELEQERDRVREANATLERFGAELRAERDRAAEANAAKTRVLASVSHDLRQPLFALSLNASALGDLLDRIDEPYLRRIDAGLKRGLDQCRGLLDQLVDFSRLESGSVDIRWRVIELGPYLQALAAPYESAARAAGLAWRLEPGAAPVRVWSDALLLERLIGNLLQNAVKFTATGTVGLRVLPTAPAGRVRLEVFDTGPGIPAAEQQRVFEEFYQLDNPSRDRARGLGLGLSIVRRLAALLGIGLQLDSRPGSGCSFGLELPLSTGGAEAEPARRGAQRAEASERHVVLAIDDEPDLLTDLGTLLGGRGYTVWCAADAGAAAALVRERALERLPDLVLADFRLRHGSTGLQAVQAVRQAAGRELPALIITGDTAPQRIAEAVATGLRVLHKPLDGDELVAAIQQALLPAGQTTAAAPSAACQQTVGSTSASAG